MTGVELTGGPRNGELEHSPLGSSRWADLGGTTAGSVDAQLLEVITGRARLVVSFDVGDLTVLTAEHVALAEAFANAACELRDELNAIVATHAAASAKHD